MTREEATNHLKDILAEATETEHAVCYVTNEDAEALEMTIEALQAQKTGRWIPCSERLPKTNGVYIVARWFGDGCEKRILSDACYFDGSDTWYDDTRLNHGREYVTHKIVAWMPLPEPYKENES